MPTEKETTAAADAVWLSAKATMTCCVPGAAGGERDQRRGAGDDHHDAAASGTEAGRPNAGQQAQHDADPAAPRAGLRRARPGGR